MFNSGAGGDTFPLSRHLSCYKRVRVLHYNITSIRLRVHTDVFMKVYWYSINSVTTMVVTFSKGLVREGNKIVLDPGEFIYAQGNFASKHREPAIRRLIRSIYGTRQAVVH